MNRVVDHDFVEIDRFLNAFHLEKENLMLVFSRCKPLQKFTFCKNSSTEDRLSRKALEVKFLNLASGERIFNDYINLTSDKFYTFNSVRLLTQLD